MHKPSILYVDDEVINLRVFKKTFRKEFDIHIAKSGQEALDLLQTQKVDVVITDQRMPLMTGTELLEKIQQLFPLIPPHRLMISGFYEKEEIEKAYKEYHLKKFIPKPWNEDEVRSIIKNVIEHE